eukprot:4036854-Amphidinium_carterae.1
MLSCYAEAWKFANKDGTTAKQFIDANVDTVYLALPRVACGVICSLPVDTCLSDHSENVSKCWAYSDLGKALFSDVMAAIVAEKLTHAIDERLDILTARTSEITEADLVEFLSELHGEIGEIQGLDCISGKREIKVPYRGLHVPVTVNSCLDEAT